MTGRVALITEIISPYRIPVFNELSVMLDGRLDVIFINETESRRTWPVHRDEIAFDYRVLGGIHLSVPYRGDRQPIYLARPLLPLLAREGYGTVVVGGWNHLECYWSVAFTKLWRRKLVLWAETPLVGALPSRPARSVLKRSVVGAADTFIVPGPSAGRYLEAHGAPPARIHIAPNAVDTTFWSERPGGITRSEGLVLLFVGRLVPVKGLDLALAAFSNSRLAGRATFLVAGDGPERARLEHGAPAGVRFLGDQDRESLRRLYHSADLLVFPSRYDPWGLVLNEAACAHIGAIASDGAGATRDLLRDAENGIVVPADDVDALRAAFDRVADDPTLPNRLGRGAAGIALSHTPRACAAGMLQAIQ